MLSFAQGVPLKKLNRTAALAAFFFKRPFLLHFQYYKFMDFAHLLGNQQPEKK